MDVTVESIQFHSGWSFNIAQDLIHTGHVTQHITRSKNGTVKVWVSNDGHILTVDHFYSMLA